MKNTVNEELNRLCEIMYGNQQLNEAHFYRFLEADEDKKDPNDISADIVAPENPQQNQSPSQQPSQPENSPNEPIDNVGSDFTKPNGEELPPHDDVSPDGMSPDGMEPDGMSPDGMEPMDDTTEIDITDLVNNIKDLQKRGDETAGLVNNTTQKMEQVLKQIENLSQHLNKMDNIIHSMDSLSKQVELMRPPTEEERRKALAQDSYPYSLSVDDYNKGLGDKTQTDMEQKMSMMNSILRGYNEHTIKDSFDLPPQNLFDLSKHQF